MTQITDSDREERNSLLKLIDCMGDDNDCWRIDQAFARHRIQALSTQAAELDALRGEVVTADHSRTCYARALEKMRIALVNINDGLEDEGDRIYLGSTNHADDIRAAWQIADALNWDEILEHTQPKTDIAATNFRLQATIADNEATIAQLRDRVAKFAEILETVLPYTEAERLREEADVRCGRTYRNPIQKAVNKARALLTQNEVG